MIKNIIFDMGGVLLYYNPHFIAKCIFPENNKATKIADIATSSLEWQELDRGMISEEIAVNNLCTKNPDYADMLRLYMKHWQDFMLPIPHMFELISELKENGYTIHLLSNASLKFFEYTKLFTIFSLFDSINVSSKMKLAKPDEEIYTSVLTDNHLEACETLFIDDMDNNVYAAVNLGMKGHIFTNPKNLYLYLKSENII